MVFNRAYLSGGQANIVITPQDPSQGIAPRPGAAGTTPPVPKVRAQPQSLRLPAVLDSAQAASAFPMVLVSPATARRIGVPTFLSGIVLSPAHLPGPPPSRAEQGAAKAALERIGLPVYSLYVERGFQSQVGSILLLMLGMASVVTLGATAVATGLAAADSRGDLGVLAAVGASPRVRRTLVMSQAATAAFLGSGLGVLAGLVPSVAVVHASAAAHLRISWLAVLVSLVAVPAIAASAAGVLTRSRLPLTRRVR